MKKEMICAIAGFAVATLTAATGGTPVVPVAGKMPATPIVGKAHDTWLRQVLISARTVSSICQSAWFTL